MAELKKNKNKINIEVKLIYRVIANCVTYGTNDYE